MITTKQLKDDGYEMVEDGYDLLSDWVVVEKEGRRFVFFFSAGTMWDIKYEREITDLNQIQYGTSGDQG
jgi:hypothetical protein